MQRSKRIALIGAATAAVVAIGGVGIATADDVQGGRGPLGNLLSRLVGDGTITQNQADAITKAMEDERASQDAERAAHEQEKQDAISKAVGLGWSAIRARLAAGETLAEIAGAKKDAVIKALVAMSEKHIDQHMADGRFTADQAAEMKAALTERVTAMVEGRFGPDHHHMGMGPERDGFGPGMHGPDHHGGFGPGLMGTPEGSGGDA